MRITIFYIIFIVVVLIGCNQQSDVIPPTQMKQIMWDMITADEWLKLAAKKDSSVIYKKQQTSLYNKIFTINKTTKEAFYSSYQYYQTHPNEMKILLDSLSAFGIRKRDTITNHLGK
jgi:hypothetical protein